MNCEKAIGMSVEAPFSKAKKTNLKIYIGACIIFAVVFGYDGYFSKHEWSGRRSFYDKHVEDGQPDDTMIFNQVVPIVLAGIAAALAVRLRVVKQKKMLATETELIISDKERIPLDAVQKVNKTYFKSRGFFLITYTNETGSETERKLSDRDYDNLAAVLDVLIAKIS